MPQVACDGGKDSLSMAASAGGETVMAPGNLVISAYVTCPDITKTLTPDLKLPGSGKLIHVDLAQGQNRHLGGSCLGQVCCASLECFDYVLCARQLRSVFCLCDYEAVSVLPDLLLAPYQLYVSVSASLTAVHWLPVRFSQIPKLSWTNLCTACAAWLAYVQG
jgi:hypothetical protein